MREALAGAADYFLILEEYLLDTNVVCEGTTKRPDARVLMWLEAHAHEGFLSMMREVRIEQVPLTGPDQGLRRRKKPMALAVLTATV